MYCVQPIHGFGANLFSAVLSVGAVTCHFARLNGEEEKIMEAQGIGETYI